MVLITLSPRGYVAEGFEILFDPFTQYLYETLSEEKDWWNRFFIGTKKVFNDKKKPVKFSKDGSLAEIRKKYDEFYLFKLFSFNPINSYFYLRNPKINNLTEKLFIFRNEWAHRDFPTDYTWADRALVAMVSLAKEIKPDTIANDIGKKLNILRDKLSIDRKNKNKEFVTDADKLKRFLDINIFSENEKLILNNKNNICKEDIDFALSKIESSRNTLKDLITPEGVATFFWDALIYKSYSYNIVKKFGGVTFEDVRDKFENECYVSNDAMNDVKLNSNQTKVQAYVSIDNKISDNSEYINAGLSPTVVPSKTKAYVSLDDDPGSNNIDYIDAGLDPYNNGSIYEDDDYDDINELFSEETNRHYKGKYRPGSGGLDDFDESSFDNARKQMEKK